jgi:pimeloyl-ACP methyl ester carboxylesterase
MSSGQILEVPGARLYYEVEGSGPALVLIHAGIANLRQWDPHVPAWAEHYRVIRYDTRGLGQTDCDHVEFRNLDDISALLDHLGEPAAHVLACSRGGAIAVDFILENPERARSLVFVAGGIGGYAAPSSPEAQALGDAMEKAWDKGWEAKDFVGLSEMETAYWVDGPGQPVGRADPAVRAQVYQWIYETYLAEKEEGITVRLDPPAATRLGELHLPILALGGEFDEESTTNSCRHVAEVVPGAEFRLVSGTAHMMNLERPAEFTAWVLEFLAGV